MRRRDLIAGFGGMALALVVARSQRLVQDSTSATTLRHGDLAALLALAPDDIADIQPQFQIAQYANPALQLDVLGIAPPTSLDDDESVSLWVRANWWMAWPDPLMRQALHGDWRFTFGFDAFQVDQSLVVGEPPAKQTIYRGRFDADELRTAWTDSGYTNVEIEGVDAYSLSEDDSVDLTSTVAQLALAQMNNAAILPDGTLYFSPTLDGLRAMVAVASGESSSLAERTEIASLVATLDPTVVSGYVVPSDALRATPVDFLGESGTPEQIAAIEDMMAEVDAGLKPMPRPRLAAVGITAGGPLQKLSDGPSTTPIPGIPLARDVIALVMDDQQSAKEAIPIIETRLRNGLSFSNNEPYRNYFSDWGITVAGSEPIVLLKLTPSADVTPDVIFRLLTRRDMYFVGWRDDKAAPKAN